MSQSDFVLVSDTINIRGEFKLNHPSVLSRPEILILLFTISIEVYSLLQKYSTDHNYDEVDSLIRNTILMGNVP